MHSLRADFLYAIRSWRRAKGSVAAAIIALALGIGATTTMFSVLAGVIVRPLPYPDADGLVMVWQDGHVTGRPVRDWVSPGLFVEWTRRSRTLEDLAAVRGWQPNLTGTNEPERLRGAAVSAGYFDALRIAPALGRVFVASDDRPGAPPVAVLSHGLWARRFGGDRRVIGRTIVLDGVATEVVGVMPASFRPAIVEGDVWTPVRIDTASAPRGIVVLRVLARVKPGISLAQARAEMAALAAAMRSEDPEWQRLGIAVVPLAEDLVGDIKPMLVALAGAVGLVLALACANVASLLLARAADRRRELTIRIALGASRQRVIRQLLVESLALAAAGGALGLLVAAAGVPAIVALAPPGTPRLEDVRIDTFVLAFAGAVTGLSAIAAGLVPALAGSQIDLASALATGGRAVTSAPRLREALVVFEIAVAMVLAAGAGLFLRSLAALHEVDLGFEPAGVLAASINPPRTAYSSDDRLRALYRQMLARTNGATGIDAAAIVSVLPLSGMTIAMNFRVDGREPPRTPSEAPVAGFRTVSPAYFAVLGMRVVEGRGFTDADRDDAERVIVVNEILARRYWPDASVVGRRVFVDEEPATVVGVVNDIRHAGPATPADAELYVPLAQSSTRSGWLVVRAHETAPAYSSLRAAVGDVDPNLPLGQPTRLDDLLRRNIARPRFVAALFTGFSALSTAIAFLGIYSVLAYAVSRRARDIGIRMALGATRRSIFRSIVWRSVTLAAVGAAAGSVLAAGLSRFLRTLLFEVMPGDPWTIAAMAAGMVGVCATAGAGPARRAARVDPITALRAE